MDSVDLIVMARLALDNSGLSESARRRLAGEANIPEWMTDSAEATVFSISTIRLWELVEHELDDPFVGLRAGRAYMQGSLGLNDYLFATSPTVGEGFTRAGGYVDVLTTNYSLPGNSDGSDYVNFDQTMRQGEGRGRELAVQAAFAGLTARARRGTRGVVNPAKVCLRQAAPRSREPFVSAFGTRNIEFGAPTDRLTFHTQDLTHPLRTADAMLSQILLRIADASPKVQPPTITYTDQLHHILLTLLGEGPITLDRVADTMHISRRSLQRRLADEGTTWRRELDRARYVFAESRQAHTRTDRETLARELGYSEARSLRRASRRWLEPADTLDAAIRANASSESSLAGGT